MDKLLDLIVKGGHDAQVTGGGEEYNFACPLCDDHKNRLYVSRTDLLWICHNCTETGNVYSFLTRILNYDPIMAGHLAKNLVGRKVYAVSTEPELDIPRDAMPEVEWPEGYMQLTTPDNPLQQQYFRHLAARGMPLAQIAADEVGFCMTGYYAGRVIVPIINANRRVGWLARDVTGYGKPKVFTAPGMEAAKVLYGLDQLDDTTAVIVEGMYDTLVVKGTVATLGAKLSREQRALLREKGVKRVVIMYDADEAGFKGALKIMPELLSAGFEVAYAILPLGEDPNSAGERAVADALDNAVEVTMETRHTIRRFVKQQLNSIKQAKQEENNA